MKDVLSAIDNLAETIGTSLKPKGPETSVQPVPTEPTQNVTAPTDFQFPIPVEYREAIDTILNKRFGIDVKYLGDTAAFEFSILVPKGYSNAGEKHWETYHEDRRSKIILNAFGSNGVREWATQVYQNFGPEIQSLIVHDRAEL